MTRKAFYFTLIFASILILSCCKKDPAPFIPAKNDTTLVQYGIPFASVCDREDAVIYQVNMRAFSEFANFRGVTARLDSIKALGVNVVYLMPIYPIGTTNSVNSPYSIKDYKKVNTEFGTLTDLRRLIEGAHNRNMSVILDWVANHTAWDHVWMAAHKDWYLQDDLGNVLSPPGMGWNDVAQLNFESASMRLAMIDAMKYWVYTANIDGFRCDYADGPPSDFWAQALDTLRNITTHKLLILAEGSRSSNFTIGFDYNFGFAFYDNIKGVFGSGKSALFLDGLNSKEFNGATNGQQVVRYITNHDVTSSDGTPIALMGGEAGSTAAFAIVALGKGVPMIYNGQEVGNAIRITFPFTTTKVDWTVNSDVTGMYKKLIAIRAASSAIRKGTTTTFSKADVFAFKKEFEGEKIFVIVNVRNKIVNFSLPAEMANADFQNLLESGNNITLGTQISLNPYEFYVLGQ